MEPDVYRNDPQLREYFFSLPYCVQQTLLGAGGEIATLGELMQIGEHLKKTDGCQGFPGIRRKIRLFPSYVPPRRFAPLGGTATTGKTERGFLKEKRERFFQKEEPLSCLFFPLCCREHFTLVFLAEFQTGSNRWSRQRGDLLPGKTDTAWCSKGCCVPSVRSLLCFAPGLLLACRRTKG